MARGYLANFLAIPPLVFRFQFNPVLLTEKKGYQYSDAEGFGNWGFEDTVAAATAEQPWYVKLATTPAGVIEDLKEIGPQLVRTHPLQAGCGEQRAFTLEFVIDAGVENAGATAEVGNLYDGDIEPDLALLRSFVNPGIDAGQLIDFIKDPRGTTFQPPQCTLIYGGLNVDCVMENLTIKITRFTPDTRPARAEVAVSLKQQTKSIGPIVETIERIVQVSRTLGRPGFGVDYANTLPGAGLVKHIFDL
jgi:hypothetical protein